MIEAKRVTLWEDGYRLRSFGYRPRDGVDNCFLRDYETDWLACEAIACHSS